MGEPCSLSNLTTSNVRSPLLTVSLHGPVKPDRGRAQLSGPDVKIQSTQNTAAQAQGDKDLQTQHLRRGKGRREADRIPQGRGEQ